MHRQEQHRKRQAHTVPKSQILRGNKPRKKDVDPCPPARLSMQPPPPPLATTTTEAGPRTIADGEGQRDDAVGARQAVEGADKVREVVEHGEVVLDADHIRLRPVGSAIA